MSFWICLGFRCGHSPPPTPALPSVVYVVLPLLLIFSFSVPSPAAGTLCLSLSLRGGSFPDAFGRPPRVDSRANPPLGEFHPPSTPSRAVFFPRSPVTLTLRHQEFTVSSEILPKVFDSRGVSMLCFSCNGIIITSRNY